MHTVLALSTMVTGDGEAGVIDLVLVGHSWIVVTFLLTLLPNSHYLEEVLFQGSGKAAGARGPIISRVRQKVACRRKLRGQYSLFFVHKRYHIFASSKSQDAVFQHTKRCDRKFPLRYVITDCNFKSVVSLILTSLNQDACSSAVIVLG